MRLLKEVRIFGKTWVVEYLDFDNRLQLNNLSGSVKYSTQTIQVDTASHRETQEATLLHEIIHAISDELTLNIDEGNVRRLEAGIYQVFKDNDLFKED